MPTVDKESTRHAQLIARLIAFGVAGVLVAVWVSIGYFVADTRKARIAEEQKVLARIARVVQEQTHSLFSLLDYFLTSADLWFQSHPNTDPRNDREFLRLVDTLRTKTSGRVDIRLISKEGGLYYLGYPTRESLADVSDRDYYKAQMRADTRGLFLGRPVMSRVTGLWGLPISYPLKTSPQGMAVIFAAIENRVLTQAFEHVRTHPNGSIFVAHRNGTVLFRSPGDEAVGTLVSGSVLWKKYLQEAESGVYEIKEAELDGRNRIVAYTTVPDYPLVVIASSVSDDILKDWQEKTLAIVAFGVIATFGCLLVLWRLKVTVQQLDRLRHEFEEQANVDDLTQIANRRCFIQQSAREFERSGRYGRPMSLLIYDVDHFKQINDTFGHEKGDVTLKAIAGSIQDELRTTDLQGRLGGEEFGVLLPETDQAAAIEVAERLRRCIEALTLPGTAGKDIHPTVSIGVSELHGGEDTLELLMSRADHALYQAKNTGRNRVCCGPTPPSPPSGQASEDKAPDS